MAMSHIKPLSPPSCGAAVLRLLRARSGVAPAQALLSPSRATRYMYASGGQQA